MANTIVSTTKQYLKRLYTKQVIDQHIRTGQKPWAKGYNIYKWQEIEAYLNSDKTLSLFRNQDTLPDGFGYRIDERAVEYPWLFSHLSSGAKRTLDAGSALNFHGIVNRLNTLDRNLTIFTLAPEGRCYWHQTVSYEFGDLREMPFRDGWFDEIISISTLEHVGSSNSLYVSPDNLDSDQRDFRLAGRELWRVLKPNGDLYITVPYGIDEVITIGDQVFMRQFDEHLLNQLLDCFPSGAITLTFYQYHTTGWQLSTQEACNELHYFNIHADQGYDDDFAAAARAVCCIHVHRDR